MIDETIPPKEDFPAAFDSILPLITGESRTAKLLKVRAFEAAKSKRTDKNTVNALFLARQRRSFESEEEREAYRTAFDAWWRERLSKVRRLAREGKSPEEIS
jgi:hypothetical protein